MCRVSKIRKVLELLAQNVAANVQPNLVDSAHIARTLNLNLAETKQILKTMHDMEVIESSMDSEYSLITRAGLASLNA
jgi:DNA-binding IclR family transcriptional regulator